MATSIYALAVLLMVSSSALAASTMNQEKVMVTVYYESLCPDSIKFFTKQLYPTLINMSNYIDLTLVPFGLSTYNKTESGAYEFTCHHGEPECNGNKYQACALKVITHPNEKYKFIDCLMSMVDGKNKSSIYPVNQCASSVGIEYNPIETCYNSNLSSEYLAELGNKTMELEPKLKTVPTIVFNNKYSDENNKMAQDDFKTTLCNQIMGMKPAECAGANNSAISITPGVMQFVTISAVILTRLY